MKRSGLQLGVVKYQRANENPAQTGVSSFGDFAIVEVNGSTYTPTNKVMGETGAGLNVTGVYSSVPVGTTVYKYGSATKYSWGMLQLQWLLLGLRLIKIEIIVLTI
mgnify:CR=1 FL=1